MLARTRWHTWQGDPGTRRKHATMQGDNSHCRRCPFAVASAKAEARALELRWMRCTCGHVVASPGQRTHAHAPAVEVRPPGRGHGACIGGNSARTVSRINRHRRITLEASAGAGRRGYQARKLLGVWTGFGVGRTAQRQHTPFLMSAPLSRTPSPLQHINPAKQHVRPPFAHSVASQTHPRPVRPPTCAPGPMPEWWGRGGRPPP